jgi:uncharacterized protein (TIGR02099 family)
MPQHDQPTQRTSRRGPLWRTVLAVSGWTFTVAFFLLAAFVLVLRYAVLPDIGRYTDDIERHVSAAIGKPVRIGHIDARWIGLHPEIELTAVEIHDDEGRVALSLPAVEAVIGWRSLPLMSLRLASLAIEQPNVDVRRDSDGRLFVAGMEMRGDGSTPGLSSWLLSQSEIVVRNARVSWDDELRAAPTLDLFGVTLVLRNSGELHRFALRAQTTRELGSALDVRAEMRGESLDELKAWRGSVYAELDHVDLGAWKQWVDYPVDIESGSGALRVWLRVEDARIVDATADVELSNVRTRLARTLPMLELQYLRGRLGGKDDGAVVEAQARRMAMKTVGGVALPETDFSVRVERASASQLARGELRAAALEMEPLVTLSEFLPIPLGVRQRVAEHQPSGRLDELRMAWAGDADHPHRFTIRSRFSNVAVKPQASWGGFAGLSGTVEATEAGGSLTLNANNVALTLAGVLAQPRVDLDALAAQVNWTRPGGQLQLKFGHVTWSNPDMSASLHGSYSARSQKAGGRGTVDLTATVQRMDGGTVWRYIPFLPRETQNYLKDAIAAGQVSDAHVRLKGDLRDFPFADGKTGTFKVSAPVANGELVFAPGWPRLAGITADVALEGSQLQVHALRSNLLGARISHLRVAIPDLYHGDMRLRLDGQAEGATSEFLRFIRSSPLESSIGPYVRDIAASGNGRLQLGLQLPISGGSPLKVAGTYDFSGNNVSVSPQLPPLSQASGRLEFTESQFSVRQAAAQFLGGPATFAMTTQREGAYTVTAQGTATIAALRRQFDLPQLDNASGAAAWRASVVSSGDQQQLVVDSPLTGVAIALPAPFGKTAAEALPLRLERTARADSEAITVSLGKLANGSFVRARSGDRWVMQRGALGINEPAPVLPTSGIAVAARFAHLDADRWTTFISSGGSTDAAAPLANVALTVGALDVAGKRLNRVSVRATPDKGGWNADVTSRELNGSVTWRPEGRGRIVARLKDLSIPDAAPTAPAQESRGSELPAIDLVANDFNVRGTPLGRLELVAVNEARDWRIEKLALTAADSTFSAEGVWQSWALRPSVSLSVKLDVRDAGVFLTRLGYPGAVRSGTAKMDGKVGWVGSPQVIDFSTLTGNITLAASRGQFLKADPGIAKLLGILSLQSWITLDFRDLFGEGFAFETLSSSAQISKGILSTEDFAMTGKAAHVSMAGVVDIARETQKLRVRVVPALGDGVSSVAGLLLANPVAGLGALVAQRLFKDPLGRIFAFEYAVTGTWSDPLVERVGGHQQAQDNPQ